MQPRVTEAVALDVDEYHALSDAYIDALVAQLEEIQEDREEVDVEYSVREPFPSNLFLF